MQGVGFQPHLRGMGYIRIVVDAGGQQHAITLHESARQTRPNDDGLCGRDKRLRFTNQRRLIGRDGARDDAPVR